MNRFATLWVVAGLFGLAACSEDPIRPEEPSVPDAQLGRQGPPAGTEYNPVHPSQLVACNVVDNAISKLPKTDGDGIVTDDELGPGAWRHQSAARGFVTFNFLWDGVSQYDVVAGRSNTAGNSGNFSDYPAVLDLPQSPAAGQRTFKKQHGQITLSGGAGFELPGPDEGQVNVNLRFVGMDSGDRIYEGCAARHFLTLFGFAVPEGGDFLIQSYFKLWARTDGDYEVLEWEFTEIDTYKNVDPDAN